MFKNKGNSAINAALIIALGLGVFATTYKHIAPISDNGTRLAIILNSRNMASIVKLIHTSCPNTLEKSEKEYMRLLDTGGNSLPSTKCTDKLEIPKLFSSAIQQTSSFPEEKLKLKKLEPYKDTVRLYYVTDKQTIDLFKKSSLTQDYFKIEKINENSYEISLTAEGLPL